MRCSIERRASGKWSVRYSFLTGDGKRRHRRIAVSGTRKDAEVVAARIATDMGRGAYADAGRRTVADLCDEWLTTSTENLAPTTAARYRAIIDLHIKPKLGALRVRDLSRRHIAQAVQEWRLGARLDRRAGGLSATSVRHHFTTLSAMLAYAVRCNYLAVNPCRNVRPPSRSTPESDATSLAEARVLVKNADDDMAAAILTDLGTGLRRGELLGLRWADISWGDKTLTVRRSLTISCGQLVIKQPKTKSSYRTIALPAFVTAALTEHDAKQAERFRILGISRTSETPIFDCFGEMWNPTNFSSMFYRLKRRAQVKCRFHDLRHGFATLLIGNGVDIKTASHLLGHASIAITGDIYGHVIAERARDAARTLDNVFSAHTLSGRDEALTKV